MRPIIPTDVTTVSATGTSEIIIIWTVPYIELTSELYTVEYGLDEDTLDQYSNTIPSYSDITLENQTYTINLANLQPLTTYYFRIRSENSESFSVTEVMQFVTAEGRKWVTFQCQTQQYYVSLSLYSSKWTSSEFICNG